MEIKFRLTTITFLGLLTSPVCASYDASLSALLGFQSKGQYIARDGTETNKAHKGYNELFDQLNFNHPDVHWLELVGNASLIPDYFKVQSFIRATASNYTVQTGLKAIYDLSPKSHVFDCYLSLDISRTFMKDVGSVPERMNILYHLSFLGQMPMANSLHGYVSFSLPLMHSSWVKYHDQSYELVYQPQISVGIKLSIWPYQSHDESPTRFVIQEPISIPVVDLVLDDKDSHPPVEEIVMPEIVAEIDHVDEFVEPQGWMSRLWEYIARLFRF